MPALAESSGPQDVHGLWSLPSMLALPTTTLWPPEVSAALVLTCSGLIRVKTPTRWLAPPPRIRPVRLMVSWAEMSTTNISSLSFMTEPL